MRVFWPIRNCRLNKRLDQIKVAGDTFLSWEQSRFRLEENKARMTLLQLDTIPATTKKLNISIMIYIYIYIFSHSMS